MKGKKHDRQPREEIIAAFDRVQAEARELSRRHAEAMRAERQKNQYVAIERRRRPR